MATADDKGAAFARDLGYLDAFFDKLEAHGAAMGGAAGDRLKVLVGEERQRWGEIRALVRGEVSSPAAAAPGPARPPQGLTVGSLRVRK